MRRATAGLRIVWATASTGISGQERHLARPAAARLPQSPACRCRPAGCLSGKIGRGPSMYEMEGPRPGLTAPAHRLLGRRALPDLPPVSGPPAISTGLPALPASPRSPPGPVPVFGSESISTPPMQAAQEVSAAGSKILWPSTIHPQNTCRSPQELMLVHRLVHRAVHRKVTARRAAGRRSPCPARSRPGSPPPA
jgi:hypothetical protein